jgi:predicted kinase
MVFKYNDILGEIVKRYPNGLVDINYAGTIETMPESLNEIKNEKIKFAEYGMQTDYDIFYEVRYYSPKVKDDITFYRTNNLDEAKALLSQIKMNGVKNPHIQQSLKNGGITMAEQGIKTGEFRIGYRPDFMKGNVSLGKEISIKVPNGESRKGQFAIVELNDVLASHNERTYNTTIGYPLDKNGENVNDRNYKDDINAQQKIVEFARELSPDRLVSTSRTQSGTPIITTDGVVISGNNRTMSIKLASMDFPDKYKEYKDFLNEEITSFGFESSTIHQDEFFVRDKNNVTKKFDKPVLVRIDYDVTEYSTMELAKWNKDTKKAERPIDKAIKLGKILQTSENCTIQISNIVGQYETFTELYSNYGDQKRLKDVLIECNILTTQEIPAYFYDRGFTEQGKELIENLLAGMVLSKDALIASNEGGARTFRQTIITSLPVLTANIGLGDEFTLIPEINEAILYQSTMSSQKMSFEDKIKQENIFGEKPSEKGVIMNRLFASGRNKFKGALESYNASVIDNKNANLFGEPPTKDEIFETHITNKIDPADRKLIEQSYDSGSVKTIKQVEKEMIQPGQTEQSEILKKIELVKNNGKPLSEFKVGDRVFWADDSNPNFLQYSEGIIKQIGDQVEINRFPESPSSKRWKSFFLGKNEKAMIKPDNEPIYTGEESITKDKQIDNGAKAIQSLYELTNDILEEKTDKTKTNKMQNPFVNGAFFKENPDKILAEKIEKTSSRWGKEVTAYRGDINQVARIDADENFIEANELSNPVVSTEQIPVSKATDSNTQVTNNLVNAISQSGADIEKKKSRKKAKETPLKAESKEATEIVSLSENFAKLSPGIDIEDVKAFLVYQNDRGRPIKNDEWIAITGIDKETLYNAETTQNLIKGGHLFYFKGEFLPKYLYCAENVYDKKIRVEGDDKQYIIDNYGQEVYDNHLKAIEEVFKIQYEKRLKISGSDKTGLIILPNSKFAKDFKVKTLADELEIKWKKVTASKNKNYGKMDLLATNVGDRDKVVIDELSLKDAFAFWLRTDETIPFHKGTNYADIINYYLNAKPKPRGTAIPNSDGKYVGKQLEIKKKEDADFERLKAKCKEEGDRLFAYFIDKFLTTADKIRLESQWNRDYNAYVPIDYSKVPVAFRSNRYFDGFPGDIEAEKREAVAFTFSEGSGLIAYDVGVGKTPSAIFTISQYIDCGWAKRPMLVVPNQTYKQWIAEFKKFAGHIPVNEFYNLSSDYLETFRRKEGFKKVEPGSVSIFTYEGMKQLGFEDKTIEKMKPNLASILLQEDPGAVQKSFKQRDKEMEQLNSKVEALIGKSLTKSVANIEDFGFDFICFDEAHACKKVFTFVKGSAEESSAEGSVDKGRSRSEYQIASGTPSFNGIKGFMLCHYIQTTFGGNTLLLTATPFTNSPLEIYSMLSMVAYQKLVDSSIDNLKEFFDTYVQVSYDLIINSKLKPQRKQVILGFNNLLSLQTLIRRFINYKSGDDVESVRKKRPNKIVLPLRTKMIDGVLTKLSPEETKDTILPLTPLQAELMEKVKSYANGEISESAMCSGSSIDSIDEGEETTEGVELDEDSLDEKEKAGVRTLKALAHARNLALSPYIFDCSGLGDPTYLDYINTSNKLRYVMDCIKSIKDYHQAHNEAMSGVIIYMDRGKDYFSLVKEYLVKEIGFEPNEIGIMSSGLMEPVAKGLAKEEQKEYIKNLFLGLKYNDATMEVEPISDAERIKVIIGSSMIREGINLQAHTSTLFNCWLDWNPSDQKQLYGRLFRQGNKFKTIRLVVPLMTDSIDIFMFEKLGQKTSRINSIWETDGKSNVFDISEFNPSDLKRILIKDPKVVAELELIEQAEKFDEDISDTQNKIKRLEKVKQYQAEIKDNTEDLREWLEDYRPEKDGKKRDIETMVSLTLDVLKKQTDKFGKPMVYKYQQTPKFEEIITTDKDGKQVKTKGKEIKDYYSNENPASKPWWFNDLAIAVRSLKRETKDFLAPSGVKLNEIDKFIKKLENDIVKLEEDKKKLTGDEAISLRASEIVAEREKNSYQVRQLPEVVADFTSLNNVLSEVKTPPVKPADVPLTCPPVNEKGEVRTDIEALKQLDKCVHDAPQTKRLHSVEDKETGERVYAPERLQLHEKIMGEFTKDAVCTDQIQPIAVLTGGAPGSGKSTFLKKFAPYLTSDKIIHIDADEIRAKLPEYEGWNAFVTHEETRDILKKILDNYDVPCKHDVLYDGTMANAKKYIPLINRFHDLGYKVFIIYMDIPKEVSIERAMGRYRDNKTGSKYGRYVPLEVIEEFFTTGKAGLEEIKTQVDGYVVVDSLSQTIIEKGGEEIPNNRDYSVIMTGQVPAETYQVGDVVEVEKSIGGKHGTKARITKKVKDGNENKYELLFPDASSFWTNEMSLKGKTTETTTTDVAPSKEDLKASLEGAKIALKYADKSEKDALKEYIEGLKISIKYL